MILINLRNQSAVTIEQRLSELEGHTQRLPGLLVALSSLSTIKERFVAVMVVAALVVALPLRSLLREVFSIVINKTDRVRLDFIHSCVRIWI
ncbi:hypothetical protein CDL15_Pgr024927 [Punica granatum]|uniref:Uncharacterized protein n=1 Tax=Punica granatum TaxID=22663 RepID=A0A218W8U1_PUNGR|nr:hypothetical protein CDL15_Pgr024927 [Punica granatum]